MIKLIKANKIKTQNWMAWMRYGMIMLIVPPATEKAKVANAVPLLRLASGKTSVGYTQLDLVSNAPGKINSADLPSRKPCAAIEECVDV